MIMCMIYVYCNFSERSEYYGFTDTAYMAYASVNWVGA